MRECIYCIVIFINFADEHLDLDGGRWDDVHVITGALKLFFRELPEPLFPFNYFDKLIAAASKTNFYSWEG